MSRLIPVENMSLRIYLESRYISVLINNQNPDFRRFLERRKKLM